MRNKLLAKLHIILAQQGINASTKRDIYTSMGVTSATEMTEDELIYLINKLEGKANKKAHVSKVSPEMKALRSEVLFFMTGNPGAKDERKRGLGIPNDWTFLNSFMEHHAGKRLNKMSVEELKDFKKKLFKIRKTGWFYSSKVERKVEKIVVTAPNYSNRATS